MNRMRVAERRTDRGEQVAAVDECQADIVTAPAETFALQPLPRLTSDSRQAVSAVQKVPQGLTLVVLDLGQSDQLGDRSGEGGDEFGMLPLQLATAAGSAAAQGGEGVVGVDGRNLAARARL